VKAVLSKGERILTEELTPSGRELDILKVLWELGSGSVRQVHEALCPGGELAFNTVQTMLRIMEDKGLVEHRAEGRTFIYVPRHSRERVAARFLDKVFDGALDQFVLSILASKDSPSSTEELKELERLIAKARRKKESDKGEDH
jgi:predicted transcriptional regulator